MTIPKSQGKLPYRDARKSSWGDLFPHPPKKPARLRVANVNGPIESDDERKKIY
jgi:ribosomal protein RSM22 (predicted rRNA methylase)